MKFLEYQSIFVQANLKYDAFPTDHTPSYEKPTKWIKFAMTLNNQCIGKHVLHRLIEKRQIKISYNQMTLRKDTAK